MILAAESSPDPSHAATCSRAGSYIWGSFGLPCGSVELGMHSMKAPVAFSAWLTDMLDI